MTSYLKKMRYRFNAAALKAAIDESGLETAELRRRVEAEGLPWHTACDALSGKRQPKFGTAVILCRAAECALNDVVEVVK